jgi:hypothetical protein
MVRTEGAVGAKIARWLGRAEIKVNRLFRIGECVPKTLPDVRESTKISFNKDLGVHHVGSPVTVTPKDGRLPPRLILKSSNQLWVDDRVAECIQDSAAVQAGYLVEPLIVFKAVSHRYKLFTQGLKGISNQNGVVLCLSPAKNLYRANVDHIGLNPALAVVEVIESLKAEVIPVVLLESEESVNLLEVLW